MIKIYTSKEVKDLIKKLPLNIKIVNKNADLYIVDEKEFKYEDDKCFIVLIDSKEKIDNYLNYNLVDVLIKPFSFEELFLKVKVFYFLIKKNKEITKKYLLLLKRRKNKFILDVINVLAHKIRQPLHIMNLIATNLSIRNFEISKEELKRDFEVIMKLNKEISSIFDDFFKFFNKDLNLKEYCISNLLKEVKKFKNISIIIKKDFKVICDKDRVVDAFLFLLDEIDVKSIEIEKNLIKLKTDKNIKFFLESGDNIKIFIIKKIIENCLQANIYQKNSTIFIEVEKVGGGEVIGDLDE